MTSGPNEMFGTKWPSITSRWIQSAPAASTLRTSSPSLEKSEARIDGAMASGRGANGWDMFSSGRLSARETVSANMHQERVQCDGRQANAAAVDAETGGQILPCFAVSGISCREPGSLRIRKPLFYRTF